MLASPKHLFGLGPPVGIFRVHQPPHHDSFEVTYKCCAIPSVAVCGFDVRLYLNSWRLRQTSTGSPVGWPYCFR